MASLEQIITEAANKYGVDPQTLLTISQLESGMDPNAKNPKSSAGGPFQFIDSTAKQYGLTDRFDPAQAADAAARLARDNAAKLERALGRKATPEELYLAHQQGAQGAIRILANPKAPISRIVGKDAARLNAGQPNMTGADFAAYWGKKYNSAVGAIDRATVPKSTPAPQQRTPTIRNALNGFMDTMASGTGYLGEVAQEKMNEPSVRSAFISNYLFGPRTPAPTTAAESYLKAPSSPLQQQAQAALTPAGGFQLNPTPGTRTTASGSDMAFQPRSVQTSTRWNTRY